MRLSNTIRRLLVLFVCAASVGCGPGPVQLTPPPGVLTVDVMSTAPSVPNLILSSATMGIDHLGVFGDVAPPRGGQPGPPMPSMVQLDALSKGVSLSFTTLPQGLYSNVRFGIDDIQLQGTWRGTPFMARFAMFRGVQIDLTSATGKELGPGQDVTFTVTLDLSSWFANNLLDDATAMNGHIDCDPMNNPGVIGQLDGRVPPSFSLR